MTWEISHTADAWSNVYKNLQDKKQEWLAKACATCVADRQDELNKAFWDACWDLEIDDDNIDAVPDWQWSYERALAGYSEWDQEVLADEAFQWIERNNTCDNGGFNFYIDDGGFYAVPVERDADLSGAYPE